MTTTLLPCSALYLTAVVDVYGWGSGTSAFFGQGPNPTKVTSAMKAVQKLTKSQMKDGLEEFAKVYEDVGEGNQ